MAKQEIPIDHYKTIFESGAKAGELICGIGYDGKYHIGTIIRIIDDIEPKEEKINAKIRILDPGNLCLKYEAIEEYLFKVLDPSFFDAYPLFCGNFAKISTIEPCSKRFAIGDKVEVTKNTNSKY